MNIFELTAVILALASFFGIIQHRLLPKVPHAIGIMIFSLITSILIILIEKLVPVLDLQETLAPIIKDIKFEQFLLEGILGFLLFAGALHVKLDYLKKHWVLIIIMASVGTAISALIIALGFSYLTNASILVALTLGVILSPTDPVVVMGVLEKANLNNDLKAKIAGESLANDGFSFVAFLILSALAFPALDAHQAADNVLSDAFKLFFKEAVGGVFLGLLLGYIVYFINKRIDDYTLELLLTITLAFSGYTLAHWLHFSAPITAIVSGLFIGHVSFKNEEVLSENSQNMINTFWILIDELLNVILFLILGIEVMLIDWNSNLILISIMMIMVSLLARYAAVNIPLLFFRKFANYSMNVGILMWAGGVKGGLSLALVLLLPDSEIKNTLLGVTYICVVFSILAQGLTIGKVAKRFS